MILIPFAEVEEKFKEFVRRENISFLSREAIVDETKDAENIRKLEKAFMEVSG